MRFITLNLPEPYIKALDWLVKEKRVYPNRAEAIRIAVRDLLNVEAWGISENPEKTTSLFGSKYPTQNSEKV